MTLPPKAAVYGLIGYPVKHSLSPAMQNAAFKDLKINAEYQLFEVAPPELEEFIQAIPKKGIYGLNVTIPYKEKVIPFLNSLSPEAKLIGAVNTIRVTQDTPEGFNTDGAGFLRHLREDLKFNPQEKIIAVIGAGGASKAISVYLAKHQPQRIVFYDIDKEKVTALTRHLKHSFPETEFASVNAIDQINLDICDLLINASPVGMKEDDPCLIDENSIHQGLLVYDLIYNPKETKLTKAAKAKGAKTANGLGMLLYQGMLSFEIWTGEAAPKEVMQQALLAAQR